MRKLIVLHVRRALKYISVFAYWQFEILTLFEILTTTQFVLKNVRYNPVIECFTRMIQHMQDGIEMKYWGKCWDIFLGVGAVFYRHLLSIVIIRMKFPRSISIFLQVLLEYISSLRWALKFKMLKPLMRSNTLLIRGNFECFGSFQPQVCIFGHWVFGDLRGQSR